MVTVTHGRNVSGGFTPDVLSMGPKLRPFSEFWPYPATGPFWYVSLSCVPLNLPVKLKTGYIHEQPNVSDSEFISDSSTRIINLSDQAEHGTINYKGETSSTPMYWTLQRRPSPSEYGPVKTNLSARLQEYAHLSCLSICLFVCTQHLEKRSANFHKPFISLICYFLNHNTGDYENFCLVKCDTVGFGRSTMTFQRYFFPSTWG